MKRPLSQNARPVNNSERIQINNNDQMQSLANNEENMDELIAKIYEENIEKITTLTNILQISEITSYISFLAFLIFFHNLWIFNFILYLFLIICKGTNKN